MLTEIALPLPDVPPSELLNHTTLSTLTSHPHLFKIVTPINVDRLEKLLESHPNQPLITSVCKGLHEGFWPLANFYQSAPVTWDNSASKLQGADLTFALQQNDEEIRLNRFSAVFGPDLLPGMYSMPIGVIPRPHSTSL